MKIDEAKKSVKVVKMVVNLCVHGSVIISYAVFSASFFSQVLELEWGKEYIYIANLPFSYQ